MTVSDETLTLRKSMNMRASLTNFCIFPRHSKTAISFNILLVLLILYLRMQFPVYYLWYGVIIQTTVYRQNITLRKYMNMRASARASELEICLHFPILKLLFPAKFCWYFWYFISETYIFSGLTVSNYNLHDTYIINAVPCSYLWYGVIIQTPVYRQNTDIERRKKTLCICEWAERASLRNFPIFTF